VVFPSNGGDGFALVEPWSGGQKEEHMGLLFPQTWSNYQRGSLKLNASRGLALLFS